MKLRLSIITASLLGAFPATPAMAQQAPDAGQILQQLQRDQTLQPSAPGTTVDIQPAQSQPAAEGGGVQVVLSGISFAGNRQISDEQLRTAVGDVSGQSLDLAGLRKLAERVGAYYRAMGYPFARAYLPPQSLADGHLLVEVVEGQYGKVSVSADEERLAQGAAKFLAALQPGAAIEGRALERATLVLDDLPGIRITPVLRPGQVRGSGDLDVTVKRERVFSATLGIDNHGNRYTGEHRVRASVNWDSPFLLGDQLSLAGLLTTENQWLGSISYSLPLGGSGLRGQVGYAHTYYELAKDFKQLDATGTAKVSSIGVSYPLVRSQRSNLSVAVVYQHKKLHDQQGAAASSNRKSSDALPVSVQFDHRDGVGGGGVTYGVATYTSGRLTLDEGLKATDASSGLNTRGSYGKLNLDMARIQALPAGLTLFGRVSAQWANSNLDSSESFSLGGAHAVRAYPSGEGNGDEGWLAQIELRYTLGRWTPYLFYDEGRSVVNARSTASSGNDRRHIAGGGIGVRYNHGGWNLDAVSAWRSRGGAAESDTRDRNPRIWLSASYAFDLGVPARPLAGGAAAPVVVAAAAEATSAQAQGVSVVEEVAAARALPQEALESWRAAWSARDVDTYLAHYVDGFVPQGGQDNAAWQMQRRQRLLQPSLIAVEIADAEFTALDDGRYRVLFVQRYRSDRFSDEVRKEVLLRDIDGRWLIDSERTL